MRVLRIACSLMVPAFLSFLLVGCGIFGDDNECRVTAIVTPSSATADHSLAAPGNQAQFVHQGSSSGNCPLLGVPDLAGSWSTSDPVNTTISNEAATDGLATCLGTTTTPATITFSGTVRARHFNTATLSCK